jgi:1-acyl-sn-glycerol-3-phosphate acyltransferase
MLISWTINKQKENKKARYKAANKMINLMKKNIYFIGKRDEDTTVFLVNHTSMMDTVLLESYFKDDVCWVGKKELDVGVGVLGVLRYPKHIILDRETKTSMLYLLKQAKKNIKLNRSIVIFPEGTRGKKDTLLPFKIGAQVLAQSLKAKVQPIVLTGVKERYDFKNYHFSEEVPVKVIFLESFEVNKNMSNYSTWYDDTRTKMNDIYSKETSKINNLTY